MLSCNAAATSKSAGDSSTCAIGTRTAAALMHSCSMCRSCPSVSQAHYAHAHAHAFLVPPPLTVPIPQFRTTFRTHFRCPTPSSAPNSDARTLLSEGAGGAVINGVSSSLIPDGTGVAGCRCVLWVVGPKTICSRSQQLTLLAALCEGPLPPARFQCDAIAVAAAWHVCARARRAFGASREKGGRRSGREWQQQRVGQHSLDRRLE